VELLGGEQVFYKNTLNLTDSLVSSVDVMVGGEKAEFTLHFRSGLTKKICAGNGGWTMNHFTEFPRRPIEYIVAQETGPVSMGACFKMEGDKIFVNTQAINSPHGFRLVIDLAAKTITKTRTLPPYHTETFAFAEA